MTSADVKIDIVQWNTVSKNACTHHLWCVCIDWATFSLVDVRKCHPRHVRFWQVALANGMNQDPWISRLRYCVFTFTS